MSVRTQQLMVRMTESQMSAWKAAAQAEGITVSELVRRHVEAGIKQRRRVLSEPMLALPISEREFLQWKDSANLDHDMPLNEMILRFVEEGIARDHAHQK